MDKAGSVPYSTAALLSSRPLGAGAGKTTGSECLPKWDDVSH